MVSTYTYVLRNVYNMFTNRMEFHEVMLVVWGRTNSPEDIVVNYQSWRYTSEQTALIAW